MSETVLDKLKSWSLVSSNQLIPALKSYADSILFYYLGYLAVKQIPGPLLEIGVGGSTHLLHELSTNTNQEFYVVDINSSNIDRYIDVDYFLKDNIKKLPIDSLLLTQDNLPMLSYIHIDGSKDFNVTKNDLEYAASKLSPMGIICQDDYGNNKWPNITLAVKSMIDQSDLELLLVGDSSCWLIRKQDHNDWINILNDDIEFSYLRYLLQIHPSRYLSFSPEYFWMNATHFDSDIGPLDFLSASQLDYYKILLENETTGYLRMPYYSQSQIGWWLSNRNNFQGQYVLSLIWDGIKGHSWPDQPTSYEEISNLPTEIKEEITKNFLSDIYKQTYIKKLSKL